MHSFPSWAASTVMSRFLVVMPPPQVLLHRAPQEVQEPHTQSTAANKRQFALLQLMLRIYRIIVEKIALGKEIPKTGLRYHIHSQKHILAQASG